MTTWLTAADFQARWDTILAGLSEVGRPMEDFDSTLYYNVNINEDAEAATAESKKFLDAYYVFDIMRERLDIWVAYGSPEQVIEKIKGFVDSVAKEITFRITSLDQKGQFQRLIKEVVPAFQTAAV
jgi:alkanesulfonate monooxygenase SsuD/methylene tetrahydromethanopterin reductase-like flavin-dependent oxidoreductase (luciferase family)